MKRDDYFTPPEAAKEMMCSPMFIRNLIRDRKIEVYRVGNRNYIKKTAVYEFRAKNTIPADDPQHSKG